MYWEKPSLKLPHAEERVIVLVKMKYGGEKKTTIAEYIPRHTVKAEDFLDPSYCDSDDYDFEDGIGYAPEGWYESPIEADVGYLIKGEVLFWMKIPAIPYI